jgi:hypothetical protein
MHRAVGLWWLLAIIWPLAACGDEEAADGCVPRSAPLGVGESVEVDVQVGGGAWGNPDVAGYLWMSDSPAPDGAPLDGTVHGRATLIEAEIALDDYITAGLIRIDFGGLGVVDFSGPIHCI